MDNGMEFKELEKNKFAKIKTENEMKEQTDKLYQMMEPEQKLEQKEELPAEKLLKERKTMPVIRGAVPEEMETSELDQIKARASWRETSMIAEQRKATLDSGKMMPLRMREQYFGEYKEAEKQKKQEQEMKERKVEQEAKPRTLAQIRDAIWENQMLNDIFDTTYQLKEDTETASESFTNMVTTADEMIRMFKKSDNVSTSDYQSAFASAWKAVNHYLDTHKSSRWTDKGERRKNLATRLKEQLETVQEPILNMLLEAKKDEMISYEDNIICQNKKEEISSYILNNMSEEYTEKKVKELAKNGTMNERIKAMMDMSVTDYCQSVYQDELKSAGFKFNEKQFLNNYKTLQDSIVNLSPIEQLEAVDAVVGMQTILAEKIMKEYNRHFNEAPDETDPEAYAILKLQNSPLGAQQKALDSFATSLAMESKSEAITEAVMNFRKLRVANMPEKEQVQSILDKVSKTQPEDYILLVGTNVYREKFAGEANVDEMNALLKSNLVTKEKKKEVMAEDLIKKNRIKMAANALRQLPNNLEEESVKKRLAGESSQSNLCHYIAYRQYLRVMSKERRKILCEYPENRGEINLRMQLVMSHSLVKDKLLSNYAESLDELLHSFSKLSNEGKMIMADRLFCEEVNQMKNWQKLAEKQKTGDADEKHIKRAVARGMALQQFKEMLRETVPEVVELAEQYFETYSKEHEDTQKESLSAKKAFNKKYPMDKDQAFDVVVVLPSIKRQDTLKGTLPKSFIEESKTLLEQAAGQTKSQLMKSFFELAKQTLPIITTVKREDVEKLPKEEIQKINNFYVQMKTERQKIYFRLDEIAEKKLRGQELSPQDVMDEKELRTDQSVERADLLLQYIENLLFLDLDNNEARISKDEAYQRELKEGQERILSREKVDYSDEEVKEVLEKKDPVEVLRMYFVKGRMVEMGTRFFASTGTETYKIPMLSKEARCDNRPGAEIRDSCIRKAVLWMNQDQLYKLKELLRNLGKDLESRVKEEFEKYQKTAPEGVDAKDYALLQMYYSPVAADFAVLARLREDLEICAGNDEPYTMRQENALVNVLPAVDLKIVGSECKVIEDACQKLPENIVKFLMEEHKWEEQREEFSQIYNKNIVIRKKAETDSNTV